MHWQVLTGADTPDGTEASGASKVEEECGGNQGKATSGLWMKLDLLGLISFTTKPILTSIINRLQVRSYTVGICICQVHIH